MAAILPYDPAIGILLPGWPQTRNPRHFASPDGLVAYWPLNRDCVDFSANKAADLVTTNIGTMANLTNAAMVEAPIDSGLTFNGTTQKITATVISGASGFSWAFWVKSPNAPGSAKVDLPLINGDTLDVFGFAWDHVTAGFNQAAYYQNTNPAYVPARITATLAANIWYHIASTWDKANLTCYLNGALQVSATASAAIRTPTGSLTIGSGGTGLFFTGSMVDVRIYNRPLSPGEINWIYQAGLSGRRDAGWQLPDDCGLPMLQFFRTRRTLHEFGAREGSRCAAA